MIAHLDIDTDTATATVRRDEPDLLIGVDPPGVEFGVAGPAGPVGDVGDVGPVGPVGPTGVPGVVLVHHGTDPNVARPDAPVVYWIGTATPVHAETWDFQVQENI